MDGRRWKGVGEYGIGAEPLLSAKVSLYAIAAAHPFKDDCSGWGKRPIGIRERACGSPCQSTPFS